MNSSIEVHGKDRIPVLTSDRKINVYVPSHRETILDTFTLSKLGLGADNAALFVALDAAFPKWFTKMAERQDTVINVGKDAKERSFTKLERVLKENGLRHIIIYGEGSTPVGLGETRPLQPTFERLVVQELRKQGYKVNLVPITYPQNDEFMVDPPRLADRELKVVVGEPIRHPTVDAILEHGEGGELSRLIRQTWMEALDIGTPEKPYGLSLHEPTQKGIATRLRRPLGRFSCAAELQKASLSIKKSKVTKHLFAIE